MTQKQYSIHNGLLSDVRFCASPNMNARPTNASVSLLVIHNISLPPEQFGNSYIEDFFCNRLDCSQDAYFETIKDVQVSAHCLIKRTGEAIQFVNFEDRAWHAGRSAFKDEVECNDFSIGIELEGSDHTAYTPQQYRELAKITQAIQAAYPLITPDRITGHSTIAPERKTDPGPAFDWRLFLSLLK